MHSQKEDVASTPKRASASPQIVAIAASIASVLTKSLLHPLDTIKCRVQIFSASPLPSHASLRCASSSSSLSSSLFSHSGLYHARRALQRQVTVARGVRQRYAGQWGPRHLYGGLPIKLALYAPYQTVYMTGYTSARDALGTEALLAKDGRSFGFLWRTALAAATAEVASCMVRVPMETVKMRIQSSAARGTGDAFVQLWRNGFRACARLALPQTLMHDVPYSVTQWVMYEALRPWTRRSINNNNNNNSNNNRNSIMQCLWRTLLSGGLSGLIASTLTVPLDNIRTRVVVATAADPSLSVRDVVYRAYRENGWRGFVRGGGMRVLWVTANMSLYFPLFELCKGTMMHPSVRARYERFLQPASEQPRAMVEY